MCFRKNIDDLHESLGTDRDHTAWRLFTDSSTASVKAVLLSNGFKMPTVPLMHAIG